MILLNLLFILIFSFLLIRATDILVVNLKELAKSTRLGEFFITSFILALATSLPELFVGISAALEGSPTLALGNVIGSNIADLSLVIGGAALIGGTFSVQGNFLKKDVFYAFLAGAAPMLLLFDKNLSRIDGLVLLALYGFYNVSVLSQRVEQVAKERGESEGWVKKIVRRLNHRPSSRQLKELGWVFFGAALLLFSSDMLVRSAMGLASRLNLPVLLIGLFLIALGTSLPELVFEIKAVKEHKPSMVFGDLLGSIVANGTLVVAVTSLIAPIEVQAFGDYLLATMAYVVVFGFFYLFIKSKRKLERWEGLVLIACFFIFVFLELLR